MFHFRNIGFDFERLGRFDLKGFDLIIGKRLDLRISKRFEGFLKKISKMIEKGFAFLFEKICSLIEKGFGHFEMASLDLFLKIGGIKLGFKLGRFEKG